MIKETQCPSQAARDEDPAWPPHCEHWYDGDACCRCGDPAMTLEEKLTLGMED